MSKSVSQQPPHIVCPGLAGLQMVLAAGKMRAMPAAAGAGLDRGRDLVATGGPSGKQPPVNKVKTLVKQGNGRRLQQLAKQLRPLCLLLGLGGERFQGGGEGVKARRWSSLSRWVRPSPKFCH